MVFVLAAAAAFCNAMVSILQRIAARTAPEDSTLSIRLILYVIRRPVWLLGILAMIGAFVLQAAALYYGQISIVQPILVAELLFILAILYVWFHSPVGPREWLGGFAIALGLAVFLYTAHPNPGSGTPDVDAWLGAAGGTLAATAFCLAMGRSGSKAKRAAFYGAAAAVVWAFTAALIKTMTAELHLGIAHLFTHWPLYAVVGVGVTGLFIVQSAYQIGPLTASQPALIIVDPIVSIFLGVWLFNDTLASRGGRVAVETGALIVMFIGVFFLSRSPLILSVKDEDKIKDEMSGRDSGDDQAVAGYGTAFRH